MATTDSSTTRGRRRARAGDASSAAPLTPPGGDTAAEPAASTSAAAPLAPPAPPPMPDPPPAPPAAMQTAATPGQVFVSYKWGHTGRPIEPDELFHDPGSQYNWVETAGPIVKVARQPGARTVSETLAYPARYRMPRWQAAALHAAVQQSAQGR